MPVNGAISAELSGRRRGCRAVESRVSCRCPALARAFRGRPPEAGTARHRSGPVCRQAVRPAARWSFPPEPPCRNAAPDASGRNWRRVQAMAARFGPGASSGQAEPVRPPHWRPPSTHMREGVRVLYPCGKTACARGGSATNLSLFCLTRTGVHPRIKSEGMLRSKAPCSFTISENGSAKNAPSAASAAARSR